MSRTLLTIRATSRMLENINRHIGRVLSWLTLVMALTIFALVVMRSVFNIGSIAIQESVIYMHALVFLLCFAFTAQSDGHVRVDIFYRRFKASQKAWVNVLGHVFLLLPFAIFMIVVSWNYVLQSWGWQESTQIWGVKEVSADPGGLAFVYLLKSLIPLSGMALAIHALCDVINQLLCICFDIPAEQNK